jgi:hypothetical protein
VITGVINRDVGIRRHRRGRVTVSAEWRPTHLKEHVMSTPENPAPIPSAPYVHTPSSPIPTPAAGQPSPAPHRKRRWWIPVAIVAAFVVGIAAGGGNSNPTASPEYTKLAAELDTAKGAAKTANDRADKAEATAKEQATAFATRGAELDTRSAALDTRQSDLEAREAAVTSTEQQVAASQIKDGTWTVGVDIEPGTYRTADAVTSMCYWAILKTGTNGADIIQNDLPKGGFPSVTLKAGQDFENSCGVWTKQ